jgi:putative ABC transport system permease protein
MRAPPILGIHPGTLFTLYAWRLRQRVIGELLAAAGIAIGVALVFGVLLANTSITSSATQLVQQLIGSARLQLVARSDAGFPQRLANTVQQLPGVEVAAPVLRQSATIVGPRGRASVQLVGVTPRLLALGGTATQGFGAGVLPILGGLGMPAGVAQSIGAGPAVTVRLYTNGEEHSLIVHAVLGSQTIGPVAASPVVITLLPLAQRLSGRLGRVTSVLVEPRRGAEQEVARELKGLAAGAIDVQPADYELRLLDQAVKPADQSTTLFAAISAMIGFLLALNAMLITVPDRRRFMAELRVQGFTPSQVVLVLGFQAVLLGLVGSLAGIALGELLAHTLFANSPNYLTAAFPIGSQRIVTLPIVLVPVACGVLAAILASLPPLLDLRSGRALDGVLREQGEAGQNIPPRAARNLGIAALLLLLVLTAGVLLAPSLTIVGGALLVLVAVCLLPSAFAAVVSVLAPLSERIKGSMLALAIVEIRATATRSIALAAVATLAVYGSVAIGGAKRDLTTGLEAAIAEYESTADVWVTAGQGVFNTSSFKAATAQRALARTPGVESVHVYQGGLLDVGTRRLWVRARPASDPLMLEASQIVSGNLAHATELIRAGGAAAISAGFANEQHLHVGDRMSLPTPSGAVSLAVAAITTNSGWPPGTITVNAADYRRFWQTADAAALEVALRPGVSPGVGRRLVAAALAGHPGLQVETVHERESQADASARQGLQSLGQIATLLLIAGGLAVAASLSAVIWQRRARLASLKTQGFDQPQLWRSLILEGAVVLTVGCLDGSVLGIYGHALADRWLRLTTDFPAPFSVGWPEVFLTFIAVAGIALAVVALPGWSAARTPSHAGFQE